MDVVDFGMNVQEAGDAPRIDHDGSSEPTEKNGRVPRSCDAEVRISRMKQFGSLCVRDTKWAMDWEVTEAASAFGLIRSERFILGASESRKDGQAAGY